MDLLNKTLELCEQNMTEGEYLKIASLLQKAHSIETGETVVRPQAVERPRPQAVVRPQPVVRPRQQPVVRPRQSVNNEITITYTYPDSSRENYSYNNNSGLVQSDNFFIGVYGIPERIMNIKF